jgi:hypothetical protein
MKSKQVSVSRISELGVMVSVVGLLVACSASSGGGGRETGTTAASGVGGGGSGGGATAGGSTSAGAGGVSALTAGGAATSGGASGSMGIGGSGGTAGTGGSGATGGAGGAGGAGGSGGEAVNAVVADDFEASAVGMAPDAARWEVFTESPAGMVAVTDEDAHGGSRSVKVVAGSNSNDHAFFVNTSVFPAENVYFRAWLKYQDANWEGHVTFIESGTDQSTEVRLGGQAGFYHANLSADGDGLSPNPFVECALCTAPTANQWVCVEGRFDFMTNTVQAWVDGSPAVDAAESSDWHSGNGMLPQDATRIAFGWESYGGGVGNTIFYDDVAIGYERLGCE